VRILNKGSAAKSNLGDDAFMYPRPLTARERDVLAALLAVDFDGAERLRSQAAEVQVLGGCGCGCPSIDFVEGRGNGMDIVMNAGVKDSETFDGLFLFTVDVPGEGDVLGGIEWVGQGETDPEELPAPESLTIRVASP
jgi:hypothetical protein